MVNTIEFKSYKSKGFYFGLIFLIIGPVMVSYAISFFRLDDAMKFYSAIFSISFFAMLLYDRTPKVNRIVLSKDHLYLDYMDSYTFRFKTLKLSYDKIQGLIKDNNGYRCHLNLGLDQVELDVRFLKDSKTNKKLTVDDVIKEIKSRLRC